ncbi:unnamed protein product [Rhizoctonia solani]|uniref:Ubiquitin-like domain-containing protein n=1 Tax=Rhizoctonia solani TaxID=456999 RepID=A0A8H3DBZ6_9AGAM|nr:unnamed protein product [Rhizoctonia solani]
MIENKSPSPFLVVEYSDRKVVIMRSTSYANTIVSIKKAFSQLRGLGDQQIRLFVRLEQLPLAQAVEELWEELVPSLSLIKVAAAISTALPTNTFQGDRIQINVVTCSGAVQTVKVPFTCTIGRIRSTVQEGMCGSLPEEGFRLLYNGLCIVNEDTIADLGMKDGDTIDLMPVLRGGKPVIYLFSPSSIPDVRVELSLVKAWRFSAIYPPTPIASPSDRFLGEVISWTVNTRPDGSLFDRLTNREVAYLFWEAHTNPKTPISPPTTPSEELIAFDPARPIILPNNSALLPFDKVTEYIDDALLAMGLHAEARTSFITYWLPNLSKHSHIALRFLPQDQYEASAPLQITPAPEITTRVFMLFTGVEESNLGAWETANVPAEEWSRIVGVDRAKAKDTNLFRVLEWGGMEIQ